MVPSTALALGALPARLIVLPGVYRPQTHTWLLAEALSHEEMDAATDVLDIGTGTGALALSAARTGARVVAVDVSWGAVIAARLNAFRQQLSLRVMHGDFANRTQVEALRHRRREPALRPLGTAPASGARGRPRRVRGGVRAVARGRSRRVRGCQGGDRAVVRAAGPGVADDDGVRPRPARRVRPLVRHRGTERLREGLGSTPGPLVGPVAARTVAHGPHCGPLPIRDPLRPAPSS